MKILVIFIQTLCSYVLILGRQLVCGTYPKDNIKSKELALLYDLIESQRAVPHEPQILSILRALKLGFSTRLFHIHPDTGIHFLHAQSGQVFE